MNEEFLVTYPSNVGQLTFIETRRKERPQGLRKPYEYILPKQVADAFYSNLRLFLKTQERQKFQHAVAYKKGLTNGFKLNVFLLAYRVGLCGDASGISDIEWGTVTSKTQQILFETLGKDARMYIEPFSAERKFQARFETYIAYTELL